MKKLIFICLCLFLSSAFAKDGNTLTMKLVMQKLEQSINELNKGILHEDFNIIARAASSIANHDKPESQKMKMIKVLGFQMMKFKGMGGDVHTEANKILELVKKRDLQLIIKQQSAVLSSCTACHLTFRKEVSEALSK